MKDTNGIPVEKTGSNIGVYTAILIRILCPVCWPGYAALLSSIGFSVIKYPTYLWPIAGILLFITLWGLFANAKKRHGFGPFTLGASAIILLLIAQLSPINYQVLLFTMSLLTLITATIWNTWPLKKKI